MRLPKYYRIVKKHNGSTLIEMSVVLALLAILATMTVSFSSLVGNFVGSNKNEYTFFEECSVIKATVSDLLSSNDELNTVCKVSQNSLTIEKTVMLFSEESRSLTITDDGASVKENTFKTVNNIVFEFDKSATENRIIKCSVYGNINENSELSQSFILSLRCATLSAEEGGGE